MSEQSGTKKISIEDHVINIVAEQLQIDKSEIALGTSFAKDLNADSLDMIEVVLKLEEDFDVKVPDGDAQHITTVGEAVAYIRKHCPDAV